MTGKLCISSDGSWYYMYEMDVPLTKFQITHASGTRVKPEGVSLREQVLIIPPCMLDYGYHYFQLKVCNKLNVI